MAGKSKSRLAARYQGAYDPAEFIVPASDSKGHSSRAQFRLSVEMDRQIAVIVASRLFPFKDSSDFLRWAVKEAVALCDSLEEIPNSVMGQAAAAEEIMREVIFHKQFEQTFAMMQTAIDTLQARGGSSGEIRRLYARVKAKFEAMPDGYWRTQYLAELARKYGHLVGESESSVLLRQAAQPTNVRPLRAAVGGMSNGGDE